MQRWIITVLLFVLPGAAIAFGQTADLSGTVFDPSKALVASASVRLFNEDTRSERQAGTRGDGRYSFSLIAPGAYLVSVTTPSLPIQQSRLSLNVGASARLDFPLELSTAAKR